MKGENSNNIVFGKGAFYVDNTLIGLTRDGGNFSVEYEYRTINADGDRGTVKGRVYLETVTPKLAINHLEVLTSLTDLHTAMNETTADSTTTITGTGKIADTDYHTVKFVGNAKDGRTVTIQLSDAINLENISWDLKEKDDIVDAVTYTATYDPSAEDEFAEPWTITYTA